jgi:cyclopropane fatty-acyl-phospholipid synthase-like methyltransferase
MLKKLFGKKREIIGNGIGLPAGADHHRAYVGPPEDYDLIAAMVFNLLTTVGLRQHHRLLDIGCGSLRVGRLFIPYLEKGNYIGVEPNRWLVQDGIDCEIGKDLLKMKSPVFSYTASLEEFTTPLELDFAVAQSIFSHCSKKLIDKWLYDIAPHLKETGVFFATFLTDDVDFEGEGWIYPGCVKFRPETLDELAQRYGLRFAVLDWFHPRQTWAVFAKPEYPLGRLLAGELSWNRLQSPR